MPEIRKSVQGGRIDGERRNREKIFPENMPEIRKTAQVGCIDVREGETRSER